MEALFNYLPMQKALNMGKAVYVTNLSFSGILLFHKAPWPAISCRDTSLKREAVAICNSVTLQNVENNREDFDRRL